LRQPNGWKHSSEDLEAHLTLACALELPRRISMPACIFRRVVAHRHLRRMRLKLIGVTTLAMDIAAARPTPQLTFSGGPL